MRTEPVEIYSDAVNAAVMRHPGRTFPGILIQGDTLHNLSTLAAEALALAEPRSELQALLAELSEQLQQRVHLYKHVLIDHGLELPFVDRSSG